MKYLKYVITSVIVAIFVVVVVNSAQNWTDNSYEGTHVAATDLQNMENNFACLKSSFSGASSPADDVAGQWWYDTTNHILKLRNEADTGYLSVWDLANARPMGLDAPGAIGGTTPGYVTASSFMMSSNTETLSGNKTLANNDYPIQFLNPNETDRDVLLPAEGSNDGAVYIIANTDTTSTALTVKEDSGTTTIGELSQGRSGIFVCDGTSWKVAGSGGGGGAAEGMMLPYYMSSVSTQLSGPDTSYVSILTARLYIPPQPITIYFTGRIKTTGAETTSIKFSVGGNESAVATRASATYAWCSELSVDCSGMSVGYVDLILYIKTSGSYGQWAIQGYSFRWGE